MTFTIETSREADGRWIADVAELPGVACYGQTRVEAIEQVQKLALEVLHDEVERNERAPLSSVEFREQLAA